MPAKTHGRSLSVNRTVRGRRLQAAASHGMISRGMQGVNMVHSAGRAFALLLPAALWACSPPLPQSEPGVLTVGPGMTYALPSQAAQAARTGNVIRIAEGSYSDCVRWNADDLVIEGVGSGAIITGAVCDDKGLFITRGRNITVRNITFVGARATSHNGSGIRADGPDLTVENSRFLDNDDGILAGNNPIGAIIVKNSLFRGNGNCIAACAHGIYAGHIALLRVENSEFEEQHVGHHIKSRAARTEILNNSVQDGPNGSASYLVDLPNGGSGVISGNRFEKGPRSENRDVAIAIGAEGPMPENPPGEITIKDNVFTSHSGVTTAFVRNYTDNPVSLLGNRLLGDVTPLRGPANPPTVQR